MQFQSLKYVNLLQQLVSPGVCPANVDVGDVCLVANLVQLLVLPFDLAAHGLRHFFQVG